MQPEQFLPDADQSLQASGAAKATTVLLDRSRFEQVLRGVNRSGSDFLAQFRSSVDADVQLLLAAVAGEDFARVAQLAHRVEGAARVIGAVQLGDACHRLSDDAASQSPVGLGPALEGLLDSTQALYSCVEGLLAALPVPREAVGEGQCCEGLRFLVVEDNEFQRSMMVRLLRRLGADGVQEYAKVESALAFARSSGSPAILLLDSATPGSDDAQVMRIAADERLALAVVLIGDFPQGATELEVATARIGRVTVLGAISKPLSAAKLGPLLRQHRGALRKSATELCWHGDVRGELPATPGRAGRTAAQTGKST